jgi:Flp pilus assembly pilin Flp
MLPTVLVVHLHVSVLLAADRLGAHLGRLRDQKGQTSAEYALVLLGAAAVALLIVAWTTKTNRVGRLLNAVFDSVIGNVR